MNLQALHDKALGFHQRGNLSEGERLYLQILAAAPGHFQANHLLGVVRHQQGRNAEALELIGTALQINPAVAEARLDHGNVLKALGRLEEALAGYDRALAIKPEFVEARYNRGLVLQDLKRFEEAITSYDKALTIKPDYAEAWNNRGVALSQGGRFQEALASYDKALAINPYYAEALNNRGLALSDLGRSSEALASYDRALVINPNIAEVFHNRGNILRDMDRRGEALASYDRALAINPRHAGAWNNRGLALSELQHFEEALASYDSALAIKPDFPEALNHRGLALMALGKFDAARAAYLQSLALDPTVTKVYANYAESVSFSKNDPQLKQMEAMRQASRDDTDRLHLDFALAKAYADLNDPARSFEHLLSGNALKRKQIQYDEAAILDVFDRVETVFTPALLREKEKLGGGNPSATPIFILGMMRSGTTLVEQILASHPDVHGAGELETFDTLMKLVSAPEGSPIPYPVFVPDIGAGALGQIGTRYLAEIRKLAPTASHITDKMPANYFFAGLIHLALPNARIIHTMRDPVDTCMSCFSKLFATEQNHTYDLGELGRYHRRYQKLMAHWRRVLPPGRILDVQYEDVVADLEGQARRIVAHCGLKWDARCLSFHVTDRPVRTASMSQVRQPLYSSAVGRARAYEAFLGPLKEALADG